MKKNNEIDVENIPIVTEEVEKPKRNWKFWKKDKSQPKEERQRYHIQKNDLSQGFGTKIPRWSRGIWNLYYINIIVFTLYNLWPRH